MGAGNASFFGDALDDLIDMSVALAAHGREDPAVIPRESFECIHQAV